MGGNIRVAWGRTGGQVGDGEKQFAITRWLSMVWVARQGGLRAWRRMWKESVWTSGWQAVGGVECSVGGREV